MELAAAEEIRIGFATPLTGPFATTGARHRTAVELAVKDLNERGGCSPTLSGLSALTMPAASRRPKRRRSSWSMPASCSWSAIFARTPR